jgi:hypothetical protein
MGSIVMAMAGCLIVALVAAYFLVRGQLAKRAADPRPEWAGRPRKAAAAPAKPAWKPALRKPSAPVESASVEPARERRRSLTAIREELGETPQD